MTAKSPACPSRPSGPVRDRRITDGATEHGSLIELVRQPWMLRVGASNLLIRGASSRDLRALAGLHSRCSARSLLDRYRAGGRGPAVAAMQQTLRRPLCFVAGTATGEIVAIAVAAADLRHGDDSAEVGLLVEDKWQGLGIAREMMTHVAGAAVVSGYSEFIAYPATSVVPAQRLLLGVGLTRVVRRPPELHLHTNLPGSATLGLGAVRVRLAS
jgi:GNAT superfamily N-acetyltransferase